MNETTPADGRRTNINHIVWMAGCMHLWTGNWIGGWSDVCNGEFTPAKSVGWCGGGVVKVPAFFNPQRGPSLKC